MFGPTVPPPAVSSSLHHSMEYGGVPVAAIPQPFDYGNASVAVNSPGSLDMMMMAAAAGGSPHPGAHAAGMSMAVHPQQQSYTQGSVAASAALAYNHYTAAVAATAGQQQGQQAGGGGYVAAAVAAAAAAQQQQTSTFSPTYPGGHGAYISMAQPMPSYEGMPGIPQFIPQVNML